MAMTYIPAWKMLHNGSHARERVVLTDAMPDAESAATIAEALPDKHCRGKSDPGPYCEQARQKGSVCAWDREVTRAAYPSLGGISVIGPIH